MKKPDEIPKAMWPDDQDPRAVAFEHMRTMKADAAGYALTLGFFEKYCPTMASAFRLYGFVVAWIQYCEKFKECPSGRQGL